MCLIAAGLLLSSFVRLMRVDKGFQKDRAMTVNLGLTSLRYPNFASRNQFMRTLLDHIHSLPGVVAAAVSNRMPLSGEGQNFPVLVEGADASVVEQSIVDYRCVNPEYFRAMGIPLLSGPHLRGSGPRAPGFGPVGADGPRAVAKRRSGQQTVSIIDTKPTQSAADRSDWSG